MSENTARRTSITYPNGRVVNLGYGATDSVDDLFSLVKSVAISGESGNKVDYTRVGLARFVKIAYPQPGVEKRRGTGAVLDGAPAEPEGRGPQAGCPSQMSMIRPDGSSVGDAGDPYDGFDRFGRVQEMRWQNSSTGTPIDAWQWGFNEASNRTWKKNLVAASGQDEAYGYDGLYQVKRDTLGTLNTNRTAIGGVPSDDEDFTYDPVGNWLAYQKDVNGSPVLDQSRSSNRDNQLTQIDGSSEGIEYDRAGNATKIRPGAGGDWTKHFAVTWDAWNRIVEVKDENGTSVQKNAYDGLTRRITTESGGTVTHTYWSDRWKPVEERTGSTSTAARSYLWGERPSHRDELVLRDRDTDDNGTLDERLYATMDYFNGTAVLNTSGTVLERYAYSAFGVRRIMAADFSPRTSSSYAWEFGFQGQFRDGETEWYNYAFRFFVPLLGRWINRDPIGEKGGVNLYQISSNSCVNAVDILGLTSCRSEVVAGHGWHEPGSSLEELIDSIERNRRCGDRITAVGCFSGNINDRTPSSVNEEGDRRHDPNIPPYNPDGSYNRNNPGWLWPDQAYAELHAKVVAAMDQAEFDCENPQTNESGNECPCRTITVSVNCQGGGYPQFRQIKPPEGSPQLCGRSWTLTCEGNRWAPERLQRE